MTIYARFQQPAYESRPGAKVELRRWSGGCERLVNGRQQDVWWGWPQSTVARVLAEWDAFERHIGSEVVT